MSLWALKRVPDVAAEAVHETESWRHNAFSRVLTLELFSNNPKKLKRKTKIRSDKTATLSKMEAY